MIKGLQGFALTGAVFLLSACATGFGVHQTTPKIEAQITEIGPPSNWAFGAAVDAEISKDWAGVIDDPQLLSLIDEALLKNLSLRASALSVDRSVAIARQSRSAKVPRLGANFSTTANTPLDNINFADRYSAGLSASWEVDLWGKIRADVAAANFDLAGAKAFYQSARQALIAQTARAYVTVIEAEQQTN